MTASEAEEKREVTSYTAKQAFARLTLHLRNQQRALPRELWQMIPLRTALYTYQDNEKLAGTIAGWVIWYEDHDGKNYEARLDCWGGLKIAADEKASGRTFRRPVELGRWILDNTDAHCLVLSRGGAANARNFGGWLMTIDVLGRGIRPVWAGGAWRLPTLRSIVLVDAETGAMYRPAGENKYVPIEPDVNTSNTSEAQWNGGFDEKSIDALLSRSEHSYWWPYCYRNAQSRYIYNRKLLRAKLLEEQRKANRSASSWLTSGILNAALGNWIAAADDLAKASSMEPENSDYRFYRVLVLLVIRDLETASFEVKQLREGNKHNDDALNYLKILRGEEKAGGLAGFMRNIKTDAGWIPLEIWIGSVPLDNE
jgi:hypothetical protein